MNKFLKYILDFIFPIECAGCGEELHQEAPVALRATGADGDVARRLCDYCFSKIEFNKKQICPLCGRFFKLGYSCVCTVGGKDWKEGKEGEEGEEGKNLKSKICNLKSKISYVDVYITFVDLKKNLQVMKLIHKLKYGFAQGAAEDLARIGVEFLKKNKVWEKLGVGGKDREGKEGAEGQEGEGMGILFIPVPLHKKRLLWRGFNQSDLILREMEREWKEGEEGLPAQAGKEGREGEEGGGVEIRNLKLVLPARRIGGSLPKGFEICNDILARKKNTFFQGKIKMREKDRILNMQDAFKIHTPNPSYRGELNQGWICGKTIILFDDVITTGATMEECARVLKKAGAARVIAMAIGKG